MLGVITNVKAHIMSVSANAIIIKLVDCLRNDANSKTAIVVIFPTQPVTPMIGQA